MENRGIGDPRRRRLSSRKPGGQSRSRARTLTNEKVVVGKQLRRSQVIAFFELCRPAWHEAGKFAGAAIQSAAGGLPTM
jgi:hypothetical protein